MSNPNYSCSGMFQETEASSLSTGELTAHHQTQPEQVPVRIL
jgi:hypothetical protein